MTTSTRARPPAKATEPTRLSDADLASLLDILKGVDSVELKMTVPASSQRTTIRGLPIDPVEAQPRQVFFFDTPDLALNAAGVVVRARRIQGGRGDSVVKLRPVVPAELPAETRRNASFNVEVDVLPGGFVCSGSFKGRSTAQEVHDVVSGGGALHTIFSKDQRAFYEKHAPAGIALDSLITLGPTFVLKTAFGIGDAPRPNELLRRIVAEVWLYPDGSRILELSTRCRPTEAFQVAAELRAYLAAHGVPIVGGQQTKTKAALSFFKKELDAQAKADAAAAAKA